VEINNFSISIYQFFPPYLLLLPFLPVPENKSFCRNPKSPLNSQKQKQNAVFSEILALLNKPTKTSQVR
jgi:hypothetical protein